MVSYADGDIVICRLCRHFGFRDVRVNEPWLVQRWFGAVPTFTLTCVMCGAPNTFKCSDVSMEECGRERHLTFRGSPSAPAGRLRGRGDE
jgi:hypothetical protein